MTLTIDAQAYGKLLSEYKPQIIRTEVENERAIALVETLSNQPHLSPEEDQILELLITLIEKFESEEYPLAHLSTPLSRLMFLMESNNLRQVDLTEVFGSKGIVSEVINGKREISKQNAIKLGDFFHLKPSVFMF